MKVWIMRMKYNLTNKLVIAVASSALFDLTEADKVFREQGENEYRIYQRENENVTLKRGDAFPLIKRILSIDPEERPVEVILLSRNDPDTGLRVFNSIEHYGLPIIRAVFVAGNNPFPYMDSFNAALFLSSNPEDVKEAVKHGFPAGTIYPTSYVDDEDDQELRIAFDFDGIIADDSAETIFKKGALEAFNIHEKELATSPLPPGPLARFFKEISNLQKNELEKHSKDKNYKPKIRIAIATARNAPAHERVITTLRRLDIMVDEAFFLGGIDKYNVLKVFKPHIFFDDQVGHIEGVATQFPSVHVPFGVANLKKD